jgi:hypothetical protein
VASKSRDGEVRIDLEKNDNRRLLSFYIGGMVSPESQDPFLAGFLREQEGDYFLSTDSISRIAPFTMVDLDAISDDGVINWDEFEGFVQSHYYSFRKLPGTVDQLASEVGNWSNTETWMKVPVKGVMSPYHRDVHVQYSTVLSALSRYPENGNTLIYPIGTTFISEHIDNGSRVEVTAMRKRQDGYWDFFAYDGEGNLSTRIQKEPRPLDVPVKCVGCHFGTRLFEPEKSFPAYARIGPDGPRAIYTVEPRPDSRLVSALDEHRKRSDQILGLYGTLLLNRIRVLDRSGKEPDDLNDQENAVLDIFNDIL